MNILTVDQGTTTTKAFVLADDGTFSSVGRCSHKQFHPANGEVEQDADELVSNIETLIDCAFDGGEEIHGIALANQGETVVAWDRRTKRPLFHAIVWQDQRTKLTLHGLSPDDRSYIKALTGLPIDPYFSAPKLAWLLNNVPAVTDAARAGHLGLGTSDTFFIDRLTGEYVTDVTTASRTSLMDLRSCAWDAELCRIFGVPLELLPSIRPSTGLFGLVTRRKKQVPIVASIVDQQAALFGHGCREEGDAKITFGTGTFALSISGCAPVLNHEGTVPTVAWMHSRQPPVYALDAGDYTASATVDWAIRLGLAKSTADFEFPDGISALERGLIFVPALSGLAAPYWDRDALGLWMGLRQNTTAADMRLAMLEGIALRSVELLESLGASPGKPISVDGGMTGNRAFVRFLAEALGRPVRVSHTPDLTALGAAELGFIGLACEPPQRPASLERSIAPTAKSAAIRSLRPVFSHAIQASRVFGQLTSQDVAS
jgi:glycerol kinase